MDNSLIQVGRHHNSRPCWTPLEARLFTDAKRRKNFAQKVFASKVTGDFAQGLLGQAQVFRHELRSARGEERLLGLLYACLYPPQGIDMAPARTEGAGGSFMVIHAALKILSRSATPAPVFAER